MGARLLASELQWCADRRRGPSVVELHEARAPRRLDRATLDEIMPTARSNYDGPVRYLENGFRVARDLD